MVDPIYHITPSLHILILSLSHYGLLTGISDSLSPEDLLVAFRLLGHDKSLRRQGPSDTAADDDDDVSYLGHNNEDSKEEKEEESNRSSRSSSSGSSPIRKSLHQVAQDVVDKCVGKAIAGISTAAGGGGHHRD